MGRFRFKRLPFGLSLSQDVFQQQMDTMLQNTEGIINIADDIIVFGTDQETHDKNLEALMIQAEKYGLVFNATKCNISKDEVSFFGELYNKDGIRTDPDRTRAIGQMQTPTTIAELRSFISIASYMSPFINNMSELLTPLRELTHKDIHFDWTSSHEQRFIQIKKHAMPNHFPSVLRPDTTNRNTSRCIGKRTRSGPITKRTTHMFRITHPHPRREKIRKY